MRAHRVLRILVVDDEPLGRRRLLDLLADEPDVEVVGTAADGAAAIAAIRSSRPDLVFLATSLAVFASCRLWDLPGLLGATLAGGAR